MKRNAMIINVARGSVLDQEALCRALEEGWIGAAGIDCQEQEPLPPHSPLWKAAQYHHHAAQRRFYD